jgi:hypothetical protein
MIDKGEVSVEAATGQGWSLLMGRNGQMELTEVRITWHRERARVAGLGKRRTVINGGFWLPLAVMDELAAGYVRARGLAAHAEDPDGLRTLAQVLTGALHLALEEESLSAPARDALAFAATLTALAGRQPHPPDPGIDWERLADEAHAHSAAHPDSEIGRALAALLRHAPGGGK